MLASNCVLRKLETTGNSSEMAVDGSSTNVTFTYTVPTGKALYLSSLVGRMQPALYQGSPREKWGCGFGNDDDPLSQGCQVYIRDASQTTVLDLTVDGAIKRNSDFANLAGGNVGDYGPDAFGFSVLFSDLLGDTLVLPPGYQVVVKIRDNLTTLVTSLEMSVAGELSDT